MKTEEEIRKMAEELMELKGWWEALEWVLDTKKD
jgi:hypothetical protein